MKTTQCALKYSQLSPTLMLSWGNSSKLFLSNGCGFYLLFITTKNILQLSRLKTFHLFIGFEHEMSNWPIHIGKSSWNNGGGREALNNELSSF